MKYQADEICDAMGTHLLGLETEEENDYIAALLNEECKL